MTRIQWVKTVPNNEFEAQCTLCKRTLTLCVKVLVSHTQSEKHLLALKSLQWSHAISHTFVHLYHQFPVWVHPVLLDLNSAQLTAVRRHYSCYFLLLQQSFLITSFKTLKNLFRFSPWDLISENLCTVVNGERGIFEFRHESHIWCRLFSVPRAARLLISYRYELSLSLFSKVALKTN